MHMQDEILVLMKFDNYHIIVLICFKWLAQSIAGKPVLVHKFDHSLKQLLGSMQYDLRHFCTCV